MSSQGPPKVVVVYFKMLHLCASVTKLCDYCVLLCTLFTSARVWNS